MRISLRASMLSLLLSGFVLLPAESLRATDFPHFDSLTIFGQSEYVAVMIFAADRVLQNDGQAAAAAQMEKLFFTVGTGDTASLGLAEFELNESNARVADLERLQKDPKANRLDVDDALFVTLKKNNINLTTPEMQEVLKVMSGFHSTTFAEFKGMDAANQHKFLAVMGQLAFPDYMIRAEVQNKLKGEQETAEQQKTGKDDLLSEEALIAKQFPDKSDTQPGFAALTATLDSEFAKNPSVGDVFYQFDLYVLKSFDDEVGQEMKRMEDNTYHLPPGN